MLSGWWVVGSHRTVEAREWFSLWDRSSVGHRVNKCKRVEAKGRKRRATRPRARENSRRISRKEALEQVMRPVWYHSLR